MDHTISTSIAIRSTNRRGTDHKNFCEDSYFYTIDRSYIIAAVFDGCSSGKDSYFASSLLSKLMKNNVKLLAKDLTEEERDLKSYANRLIEMMFIDLMQTGFKLQLDINELLSTIVLTVIDIRVRKAYTIIAGDGVLMVNGEVILDINMPGNAPNYMAYYLNDATIGKFMDSLFIEESEGFDEIAISTDGIDTFNSSTEINAYDFLIKDKNLIKSEAMLSRKCNILENKGVNHKDDLTIIRIIFNNEDIK